MKGLIEALQIMLRYFKDADKKYPTHCEHDILYVWGVDMEKIPFEKVKRLIELGFVPGMDDDIYVFEQINEDFDYDNMTKDEWERAKGDISNCFHSYRYGSC